MKLSRAEVEHVADLARLALTDEEKERFQEQLSSILEYAGRLQALDMARVPPTAGAPTWGESRSSALRDDEERPSLPPEDVLANAPLAADGYFQVPVVLEGDE